MLCNGKHTQMHNLGEHTMLKFLSKKDKTRSERLAEIRGKLQREIHNGCFIQRSTGCLVLISEIDKVEHPHGTPACSWLWLKYSQDKKIGTSPDVRTLAKMAEIIHEGDWHFCDVILAVENP